VRQLNSKQNVRLALRLGSAKKPDLATGEEGNKFERITGSKKRF
jgi:hypothetical protein